MSITIDDEINDTTVDKLGSIGKINLPKCDHCVSCNVCKFKETYQSLSNSLLKVLATDFSDEVPPGKINITCDEYRSKDTPTVKAPISREVVTIRERKLSLEEDTSKSTLREYDDKVEEQPHTSNVAVTAITPNELSDEERRKQKNSKAIDSIDFLVSQLESNTKPDENVSEESDLSEEKECASNTISEAEKNYKPINLYGRLIDYNEALELVKRGILVDCSIDPNHPVFNVAIN